MLLLLVTSASTERIQLRSRPVPVQNTKFEDDSVSANAHGGRLGGASEIAAQARPGASATRQHAARCEKRMVIFILTAAYYTKSATQTAA